MMLKLQSIYTDAFLTKRLICRSAIVLRLIVFVDSNLTSKVNMTKSFAQLNICDLSVLTIQFLRKID